MTADQIGFMSIYTIGILQAVLFWCKKESSSSLASSIPPRSKRAGRTDWLRVCDESLLPLISPLYISNRHTLEKTFDNIWLHNKWNPWEKQYPVELLTGFAKSVRRREGGVGKVSKAKKLLLLSTPFRRMPPILFPLSKIDRPTSRFPPLPKREGKNPAGRFKGGKGEKIPLPLS